jgi:hypothetical protein
MSSPESDTKPLNLEKSHWLEIMMDTFRIKRYKTKILLQYTLFILKNKFGFKQSVLDKHCKRPNTVFSVIIMVIFRLLYKFIDDDYYLLASFDAFIGYKLAAHKWFELEAYIFGKLNWNLLQVVEESEKEKPQPMIWDRSPKKNEITYAKEQQEMIQEVSNIIHDI